MYSVATVALIVFGFGVLVVTFVWIAKLLTRRRTTPALKDISTGEAESTSAVPDVEEVPSMSAMILGANYGLVLGILACLLFTILAPMMLIISAAGLAYSSRAFWQGFSRYRMIVFRALAGLLLSVASVGLHYLHLTSDFPAGLIPADLLPGMF